MPRSVVIGETVIEYKTVVIGETVIEYKTVAVVQLDNWDRTKGAVDTPGM